MKIEVLSGETRQFSIDGRQYQSQTGWAHMRGAPYPQEITFTVDRPLPPGEYLLDVEACCTVRNRKLQLSRLQLLRAAPAAAAAPAPVVAAK